MDILVEDTMDDFIVRHCGESAKTQQLPAQTGYEILLLFLLSESAVRAEDGSAKQGLQCREVVVPPSLAVRRLLVEVVEVAEVSILVRDVLHDIVRRLSYDLQSYPQNVRGRHGVSV